MHSDMRGAILATVYAGISFGVFWIPLRALEESGLPGPWASLVFTALPLLMILPVFWLRRGEFVARHWKGILGGCLAGIAFGFYTLAFLYTEVVRAVILFYLTPIWGFLLGRFVLGEAMTPVRWAAVVIGFAGIAAIFGVEDGVPLPRNTGDWVAILSGLVWALGSLFILLDEDVSVPVHAANFFLFSAVINAATVAGLAWYGAASLPPMDAFTGILPWMIPVTLILLIPTGFATIYGPTRLTPGVVGLLFMAEVAVAAIAAALLTDEPFGAGEALGVLLILGAGLLVPLFEARVAKS